MKAHTAIVIVALAAAIGAVGLASPVAGSHGPAEPSACSFPYGTTDATGADVRLDREPERVVTLSPSAAQTMWEIGAREKVVGLTKYAGYLDGAETRANVSGATDIVVTERVVDLEPDLVLAPNATSTEIVAQLRSLGLTVYHFREAGSVEGIYRKTRLVGRMVGACDGAAATVSWMYSRMDTVGRAVAGQDRPDVLYAFFGYTAGRGTFVHRLIEAAGGNNVAADHGVTGYRQLNPEVIVDADPDWIVRNSRDPVVPPGAPFNATTAVREGQVVVVPIEHLNQPAPRVVLGVATLARHFHPAAYSAANETTTAATTDRATASSQTARPRTPTTTPTTTAGQPGLGIVVGLLGVGVGLGTRLIRS